MAYFACGTAALTGTDKATRNSIAKGIVSPVFTNSSGQQILRGVVQYDILSGRDTGYATNQTIRGRLAAAVSASGLPQNDLYLGGPPSNVSTPAQLYSEPSDTIKTTSVVGLNSKFLTAFIAVGAGIFILMNIIKR